MKPVIRLILKLALLGLPILVTLATYFYYDPFMVLRSYAAYSDNRGIELNRDYVSTEMFLKNDIHEGFDSFIFGNSRTLAFTTKDWLRYIAPAKPYHFDASSESIFGIAGKLDLLDRKGSAIRHALVLLDASVLRNTNDEDHHLLKKHPLVSNRNALAFQTVFARAYLSPTFAVPYLSRKLTGQKISWLPSPFSETPIDVDPLTNDIGAGEKEHEAETQPEKYYAEHAERFYPRADKAGLESPVAIGDEQIKLLERIKAIFEKHHTQYTIVISPLYDQRPLHRDDVKELKRVFGVVNVFDFSGINEFTKEIHNYYEESHFRPHVGRRIFELIYAKRN